MSIAIGVPNGIVNLPTVHMVQTFRGNYVMDNTAFVPAQPKADLYFGTFFYSNVDVSGRGKVNAASTILGSVYRASDGAVKVNRASSIANGGYNRTPYNDAAGANTNDAGAELFEQSYTLPLFAFDFDGVQGAIKAKGDEKWITYKGMYDNTITFTSVFMEADGVTPKDGYGADATLSVAEMGYREGRGTWRYKMNEEASMARSIPYSGIAGINEASSTITKKYSTVLGVTTAEVPHSLGRFKLTDL